MGRRPVVALLAIAAVAVGAGGCGEGDGGGTSASAPMAGQVAGADILSGTQTLLDGRAQDLRAYRGEVVLVVNTASECGFAPQFDGLERLYREHRSEGFVVLGFPADDVAGQEPRSDEQIADFCEENFGVSFPMFAKSNVVSEPVNPLFARLAETAGPPSWNFNKYLLDREGEVIERYDAGTAPDDAGLNARIDELLSRS